MKRKKIDFFLSKSHQLFMTLMNVPSEFILSDLKIFFNFSEIKNSRKTAARLTGFNKCLVLSSVFTIAKVIFENSKFA